MRHGQLHEEKRAKREEARAKQKSRDERAARFQALLRAPILSVAPVTPIITLRYGVL